MKTTGMAGSVRPLRLFLRVMGGLMALGIIGLLMPRGWMVWSSGWLGLGPFPEGPLVVYLARATSGLCATIGGLFLLVSSRPVHYAAVIGYLAAALIALGFVGFIWALRTGMPAAAWFLGDAAAGMATGIVLILLQRQARKTY